MKIDTLKSRVSNAEKKVEKIKGILDKHITRLEKIKSSLEKYGVDLNNYDICDYRNNDNVYELIWSYELKLDDVKNNEKKLNQANKDLEKASNSLEVEIKKKGDINNVIPQCIIDFLENWKKYAKEFYINLSNEYLGIRAKKYEVTEEELKKPYRIETNYKTWEKTKVRVYKDEDINFILNDNYLKRNAEAEIKDYYIQEFRKNTHATDLQVMDKILNYNKINLEVLEKILDNEIEVKKELFIERIREVVGVIEDLSELYLGDNGEINGIVQGEKCKAKVQTIGAGGYNIQCYHYRVLVNKIK